MLREFSREACGGRPIVLCGPLLFGAAVLRELVDGAYGELLVCDPAADGRTFPELVRVTVDQLRRRVSDGYDGDADVREAVDEACTELLALQDAPVRSVSLRELATHGDACAILTGRGLLSAYCKALGRHGLDGFFSAASLLKDGSERQSYLFRLAGLLCKQEAGLYLGGVEVVLTTRCTLRCRDCANLIPYYRQREFLAPETVLPALQRLFDAVDGVGIVKLMGGEPLLEQGLLREALVLLRRPQNRKFLGIQVVTNATLAFEGETLDLLESEPLAEVVLSNYGDLSVEEDEVRAQLDARAVPWCEVSPDQNWIDYGKPGRRCGTPDRNQLAYERCSLRKTCCTVLNGVFHLCPRAAHGELLGLYPPDPSERVDVLEHGLEVPALRNRLSRLYHRSERLFACDFCNAAEGRFVCRAVQR